MSEDSQNLEVDILGDRYILKVDENQTEESVLKIVDSLKERMNKLRAKFPMLSEKKFLVLLSLNLMEELTYYRKNKDVNYKNKEAFVKVLKEIEKLIH